jgi:16S rRNA (cytidine1402-2'-O)-methyltransferase
MTTQTGKLYVVATPIGNLADLSPRAVEILKSVALILAEDTRHSKPLLQHFGVHTRMESCHEHNERDKSLDVLRKLALGESCALISDAGTPVFSDPGATIVNAVLAAGYVVIPVPGPCAAIAALSASGFEGVPFHFYGFLPAQVAAKRKYLEGLCKNISGTLCFYESPHRLLDTLEVLQHIWGEDKEIVLAKEITKLYEQVLKKRMVEILLWLREDPKRQQGEFVILFENSAQQVNHLQVTLEVDALLQSLMSSMKLKEAVALLANLSHLPKNALYERALILKGEGLK